MDPDEDDDLPLSIADTKSILSKKKGDPLDDDFDDLTVSTHNSRRSLVDALAGARGVLDDEINRIDEVLGDASVRRAQHAREFGQPVRTLLTYSLQISHNSRSPHPTTPRPPATALTTMHQSSSTRTTSKPG